MKDDSLRQSECSDCGERIKPTDKDIISLCACGAKVGKCLTFY